MGAVHKFDLTSDVTHLIVGDHDTPKYKFVAKERADVKVMLPSWIDAVRAMWLEGGATDVDAAESQHMLPTFHGLRICVTGFDDLEFRKQLEEGIIKAGGEYSGNLTRDITHLIAKKPGSEKYEYAKHREIKIVSIEWHDQSLERGMILDEALYHPLLPASERGKGAWARRAASTTSLGKRTWEGDGGPQLARKLRRTASARFETHNENLWTDIVSAEVTLKKPETDDWDNGAPAAKKEQAAKVEHGPKHIPSDTSRTDSDKQILKRSQSMGSLESLLGKPAQQGALFHDATFLLHRFDERKATILLRHLFSHGASVVNSLSDLPPDNGFLLIPHTIHKNELYEIYEERNRLQAVTDLWVERCLHQKRMVDPIENVMSTPLRHFPIIGFEKLNVSSTGFQGIDLLHTSKAVNLLGGTYHEYFTKESTVLVCNKVAPGHEKLRHAFLWGIAVVKAEWLLDCLRKGEMMEFDKYLIHPPQSMKDDLGLGSNSDRAVDNLSHHESNPGSTRNVAEKTPTDPLRPREQIAHPRRRHLERKSEPGLGKSLLNEPFPDNAGPLLLPDEAEGIPDASSRRNSTVQLQADFKTDERPPLHETTPNSSPPKVQSSKNPQQSFKTSPPVSPGSIQRVDGTDCSHDENTLGPVISSLLSHHQAARSSNIIKAQKPTTTSAQPPQAHTDGFQHSRRRRRQLLGRAPSNVSSCSIKPSRASSIDTQNTDGLGTPLDANHSYSSTTATKTTMTATAKASDEERQLTPRHRKAIFDLDLTHDEDHDPDRPSQEHLQMTQLGYADPNVTAWRERVALKMAGGTVKGEPPPPPAMKTPLSKAKTSNNAAVTGGGTAGKAGRRKDGDTTESDKSLGIAKRTRLASGGGGGAGGRAGTFKSVS